MVLLVAVAAAVAVALAGVASWPLTAAVWLVIGGGMAMIITPTGRILRGSVEPSAIPEVFAAQFSLSHLAWLITYPIAGWVATSAGFLTAWWILAGLAVIGAIAAVALWRPEPGLEAVAAEDAPAEAAPAGLEPEPVHAEPHAHTHAHTEDLDHQNHEAATAEGTLVALQCSCVRPV